MVFAHCRRTASSAMGCQTIVTGLLEAAADPLDQEAVRHDLLLVFDRLSLVLKREGQAEEALEEIDSAASLGLLDCRDHGIKGHREALTKRRESLRRAATPLPSRSRPGRSSGRRCRASGP